MMKIPQKIRLCLALGPMNLRMDLFIQDSGKTEADMEEENNIGMMAVYMKVTGGTVISTIKKKLALIICLF